MTVPRPMGFTPSIAQESPPATTTTTTTTPTTTTPKPQSHSTRRTTKTGEEGYRLDPPDWEEFRTQIHRLVDICIDRMMQYRDYPWQAPDFTMEQVRISSDSTTTRTTTTTPKRTPSPSIDTNTTNPNQSPSLVSMPLSSSSSSSSQQSLSSNDDQSSTLTTGNPVMDQLVHLILPSATGNTHPRFWGWVHGGGIPICLAADIVATTMNSNCGGRDHGAVLVERACLEWLCTTAGFHYHHAEENQQTPPTITQNPFMSMTTDSTGAAAAVVMPVYPPSPLSTSLSSSSLLSSSSSTTTTTTTTTTKSSSTTTAAAKTTTTTTTSMVEVLPIETTPSTTITSPISHSLHNPRDPFGIITTGTSQATILAFSAARTRACGNHILRQGIVDQGGIIGHSTNNHTKDATTATATTTTFTNTTTTTTTVISATGHLVDSTKESTAAGATAKLSSRHVLRVYAGVGTHTCVVRALQILGHGSDSLVLIPLQKNAGMDLNQLREAIRLDRLSGFHPWLVVATAGSVSTGTFDDLRGIAALCEQEGLWMHVDAAFGYWTRLADEPYRSLTNGLERADSIATDAHKWPGVPYDCGICLVRDGSALRQTFGTNRPAYLASTERGLAGGSVWFTDYGMDLSRGFRALKLWTALQECGPETIGAVITDNCKQATFMASLVQQSPWLQLQHAVVSNICIFSVTVGNVDDIAAELQLTGQAVFSTIVWNDIPCLRAAIVNHRTTREDVIRAIRAVECLVEHTMRTNNVSLE